MIWVILSVWIFCGLIGFIKCWVDEPFKLSGAHWVIVLFLLLIITGPILAWAPFDKELDKIFGDGYDPN